MNRQESTEWLKTVHKNVSDLYIVNDLFWQFHTVVSENDKLAATANVFFGWVNALFSDSIAMRVRREVDTGKDCVSTLELLRRLRAEPAILDERIADQELAADIEALAARTTGVGAAAAATIVRGYADRRVASYRPEGSAGSADLAIIKSVPFSPVSIPRPCSESSQSCPRLKRVPKAVA